MKARSINPFSDFGFKRIFSEEASKHLLKNFLNAVLPTSAQIAELSFDNAWTMKARGLDPHLIAEVTGLS